jgi:hypothetical protein
MNLTKDNLASMGGEISVGTHSRVHCAEKSTFHLKRDEQ